MVRLELTMQAEHIRKLLPGVIERTIEPQTPLAALLDAMEALHAPAEDALEAFPIALDPRLAPPAFVPMLAAWVDLDRLFGERHPGADVPPHRLLPTGLAPLRELVANAAELSRWRGTRRGLFLFLRLATGLEGFKVQDQLPGEDTLPRPFFVRITAPAAARPFKDLIERIVRSEKPAYINHEIIFDDEKEGASP